MRRRWIAVAGVAGLGLALAVVAVRRHAQVRLVERRLLLERLVAEARASTAEGDARLASGEWDLLAQVPASVVERLLQEFVGYRQVTRRGNAFVVRSVATQFHAGYAELRATADFRWRLGLYDGPVEATYFAFARVGSDGGCDLFFRIAELRTLAPWPLLNRFLEPILTYRMQRSLGIPNLRLPLGLAGPPREEAVWSRRFANGLEVTVPARAIDLGPRRALPLLDGRRLGVVVARPAGLARPAPEPMAPRRDATEEVEVAVRLDFLGERLARAVAPESDLRLSVERLERVWSRRSGGGTEMSADLVNVRGTVDLRQLELEAVNGGWAVGAEVQAVFAGQVEASVWNLRHAFPVRVTSTFRERLPLRVIVEPGAVSVQAEARALSIPLEVEARVATMPVRISTTLEVPADSVARAARLPGLVLTELRIPTQVERGRVLESRSVPLTIDWSAEIPATASAPLRARGRLRLGR